MTFSNDAGLRESGAFLLGITAEQAVAPLLHYARARGVRSVGVVDGRAVLDLDYPEDVSAGTDMNVVCTGDGRFVEVQGTAEGAPFDRAELDVLLDLAGKGCAELTRLQEQSLSS